MPQNSFIQADSLWIHFPQHFGRKMLSRNLHRKCIFESGRRTVRSKVARTNVQRTEAFNADFGRFGQMVQTKLGLKCDRVIVVVRTVYFKPKVIFRLWL